MLKQLCNRFERMDRKRLRAALWALLAAYAFVILYFTILKRKPFEGKHLELRLFWSYQWNAGLLRQIIGNIVIFIPVGFLYGMLSENRRRVLVVCGLYSALIELLQWVFKLGLCELDDIVHNLLGAAIGLILLFRIRKRIGSD